MISAGSAVLDITPVSPAHLAGYAARDHGHESVHDPISVRALFVSNGIDVALLVTGDIIWFTEDVIDRITPVLADQLGLDPLNVMFAGSHTHSAPNPRRPENADWVRRLEDQVVSAAAIARTRLQPVTLESARGTSDIGVNRREQVEDGRIILGINPDGPCDKELILTRFKAGQGSTVATVGCFACHGTTLSQRNYRLSGDWSGVASTTIEASGDHGAFLYLNGGAADICPRVDREESFAPVESQAAQFVRDLATAASSAESLADDDTIRGAERTLELPRKSRDVEDGKGRTARVRIKGLRIGPLTAIGFPGEVFTETAIAVKAAFPDRLLMVCSYADGGSAGYVPVRTAYDTGGYEVRVAPYAEAAEETLRTEFKNLAQDLS